jgi:WhiB family redox-sensing transcriptional regulator
MKRAPLLPVSQEWNWQLDATCRGMDVEIFFHPASERRHRKQRRIDQARAICHGCPVLEECRRHALRTREPYGIWGGLSEEERAEILGVGNLRYPAQRRRKNSAPEPTQDLASPPARRPESASTA